MEDYPKRHKRGRRKKMHNNYQAEHRAQLVEQLNRRFHGAQGGEPSTSSEPLPIETIPLPSEMDFSAMTITEKDYENKDYMKDPKVISTHSAQIPRSDRIVKYDEEAEKFLLKKVSSSPSKILSDFRCRVIDPLRHKKSLQVSVPYVEQEKYEWNPVEKSVPAPRVRRTRKIQRIRHDLDEEESDDEGLCSTSSEEELDEPMSSDAEARRKERKASMASERMATQRKIYEEIDRKRSHPNALHPELMFNEKGLGNDGPECKCAPESVEKGVKHGKYPGEEKFNEQCEEGRKLHHYFLKVTPAPNDNQYWKTSYRILGDDYVLEGFSLLTHEPLPHCMTQNPISRFPLDYEHMLSEEMIPKECYTPAETTILYEYLFHDVFEMLDFDLRPPPSTCPIIHLMPRFVCSKPDGLHLWSTKTVMAYFLLKYESDIEFTHRQSILVNGEVKPAALRVDGYENEFLTHNSLRSMHFSPKAKGRVLFLEKRMKKMMNGEEEMNDEEYREMQDELEEIRARTSRVFQFRKSFFGFHETGLRPDVAAHIICVIHAAHHIRYNFGISEVERVIRYQFNDRQVLELAMTHSSFKCNYGTPTDHVKTLLGNCGYRKKYGGGRDEQKDRKKGIVSMFDIISGQQTSEPILHNERLEYLGDAVVELIVSHHLFFMFPHHLEGGLATYRTALVQNRNLASLAINCRLDELLMISHGAELSNEADWRHALANSYEAFMAAVYLDGGMNECDRIYSESMWNHDPEKKAIWDHVNEHELKREDPHGDREISLVTPTLKNFHKLEETLGIQFNNIRLLAKAFTRRHIPYNDLTKGHNQRLEWLGDSVLQLHVTDYLFRHFPNHHEGHMSLLRTSLVSNETQAVICDDLGFAEYAIQVGNRGNEMKMKDKADLVEAFIGALYVDQGIPATRCFVRIVFLPRLNHFIDNEKWNDPKSHLQQWCQMLRDGKNTTPAVPDYRVIQKEGPTNSRIYTVAVYFRNARLAMIKHNNIHKAELLVAELALQHLEKVFRGRRRDNVHCRDI